MDQRGAEVTWKKADRERIPDDLAEGVALVLDLVRRKILEPIGERVRIRRKGGYCGFDVLLFLLLYFATARPVGIRRFWAVVHPCSRQLAATAHRDRLASPSSLSRALEAVEPELLRPASEWLLAAGAGIDAVLRHPAVQIYDGRGEGWHVFDFDPTVTTLRQRALPEGDDLPAAQRRSQQAAAGYAGRKRGEVQFRRGTLQHAGSGLWLQAMLEPGNGKSHAELSAALAVVERTCQRLGHPLSRTLLRMDGAFGWIPYLAACRAHGVPCLTRLTRPELFEQADVLHTLHAGTWHFVPDSCCGPRRSALNLGVVTIPPGQDTRRADGTPYEPLAVRVVVSRYPRTEAAEHGRVIDGWQYELFLVDVTADALPAPAAVGLYFGRAAQENRFAQEDREVGLDRIFSYHLPGQEFAVVVGLLVWNLRLARGFELAPPPVVRPVQEEYVAAIDARVTATTPGTPAPAPVTAGTDAQAPSAPAPEAPRPVTAAPDDQPLPEALVDGPPRSALAAPRPWSAAATADTGGPVPVAPAPHPGRDELVAELRRIDWQHALRKPPDWSWDETTGHLRCADGRELVLTTVRQEEHAPGRTSIIFCRPGGGCDPCDARPSCLRSARPRAAKHLELAVPTLIAARVRQLVRARRQTAARAAANAGRPAPDTRPEKRPRRWFPITVLPPMLAQFTVLASLFLPATARHTLRAAAVGLTVAVNVILPPLRPLPPLLVAQSVADLQHRRQTWQQNFDRHALPPEAQVHVELAGGGALRRLLGVPHVSAMA